jgi:long-chain acyl-CoA synthetase
VERAWLAHYDPGVPHRLDYPDITLPELLAQTANRYPSRKATIFHGRSTTYRTLNEQAIAFGAGLKSLGIRSGDRVALMLPNLPQYIVAFYGTLYAGAIAVPTNPLYTQHELEHQLNDSESVAIVTLEQFFGAVQAALPYTGIRTVVVASVAQDLPLHLRPVYRVRQRFAGYRQIRAGGVVHRFPDLLVQDRRPQRQQGSPDDIAVLQYTGGTTGISKAAMLTHRNLIANAFQAYYWQGATGHGETSILCAAPFFHVYGMSIGMNLAIVAGATILPVPRWSPKEVAKIIAKQRPELFPGVPTMYLALANLPGASTKQLGSLRVCISGAAPLPEEVQNQFQEVSGARLTEGYGLTEASPVTHCNPVNEDIRPGTVGVPFPDTDARITDPDTWEDLPFGTIGEMTVKGPQVMSGYWKRPEETAAVLRGGWLHTGDLATMDEDGYFRIVDRKKDLIIASGYNVYPREIDDVLYSHSKVLEAAAIGVPSDYRGETVKAFIVLKDGENASADEIITFCREHLAAYKVPRIIEFRDELPKTLIGKVLRRELRTEAETQKDADSAAS